MSTTPPPGTSADYRIFVHLLNARPPAGADLGFVHGMLTEDPGIAIPAFGYWAAGIDPDSEGSVEQLAQYLVDPPQSDRSPQVYRTCLRLASFSAFSDTAPSDAPREVREDARITYLLWAALTCPRATRNVLECFNEAGRVNLVRAISHPLWQFAIRRLTTRPTTPEVQR